MIALFNWAFYKGRFWRRCVLTSLLGVPDSESLEPGSVVLVRLGEGVLCTTQGSGWPVTRSGLESLLRAGTLVPWTRRFQKVVPQAAAPKRFPCIPSEQADLNSLYAEASSVGVLSCDPDLCGTTRSPGDTGGFWADEVVFASEESAFSDAAFTQHHHRLATDFLEAVASAEAQEHECLCVDVPRDRVLGFVDRTAKEVHLVPLTTWAAYKHWCLHMEGKPDPRWENWSQKYHDSKYKPVEVAFSESTPA